MEHLPKIIIVVLSFFSTILLSQNEIERSALDSLKPDIIKRENIKANISEGALQAFAYEKMLTNEFSKILNGQTTSYGSFFSLGTKDDIATLSGNIWTGHRSALNITAVGGVSEGIVSILNGEKVNPNIQAKLQYNFRFTRAKKVLDVMLSKDATKEFVFYRSVDSLRAATAESIHQVDLATQRDSLKLKLLRERSAKISAEKKKLSGLNHTRKKILMDSLVIDSIDVLHQIKSLEIKLETNDVYHEVQKIQLQNAKVDKLEKLISNYNLDLFNLKWVSIYGKISNITFNSLDQSKPYKDQISKISNTKFEIGGSLNFYHYNTDWLESIYLSLGAAYINTDNFEDLTKFTITEKTQFTNSSDIRDVSTNRSAFSGIYETNINSLKLSLDAYWFLAKNQHLAFHLYPNIDFIDGGQRNNLLVGLFLGVTEKSDNKNTINIELYYDMKYINKKVDDTDEKLSDRSNLGLRVTFPIFFKSNKPL